MKDTFFFVIIILVKINFDTGVIMQKISFLLLGTSLSFIPQTISAAECAVTDCSLLGYTDSACPGSGLKCPFGDGWYCGGGAAEDCIKLGYDKTCTGAGESGSGETCNGKYQSCTCDSSYQYTCSGTGYSGGAGSACGGKYTACTCTNGYEWKDGSCSKIDTCTIGALYYSDGTCSDNLESGKTLLGVVIMEKTSSTNGWIMTVQPVQNYIMWGGHGTDIPGLSNCTSISCLTDIQASCTNTDIITTYGTSSTYPAAWAAKNYKPTGTPSGKSWCLPSGGLLNSTLNNSTNFAKITAGITTAGGSKIGFGFPASSEYIWASSEYNGYSAWSLNTDTSGSFNLTSGDKRTNYGSRSVRPVLAF